MGSSDAHPRSLEDAVRPQQHRDDHDTENRAFLPNDAEEAADEAFDQAERTLLPDAFVYEYDGEENGCYRLRFHPNPNYTARTIEARIFHAMSGKLWVDARFKRLARLEGRVEENVDFGFGILGRLYQGGWFRLERVQVSPTDWKTKSLEVHMNIRALLVKNFARETSETRGGFAPVPAGMSLALGLALLEKEQAQFEALSIRP